MNLHNKKFLSFLVVLGTVVTMSSCTVTLKPSTLDSDPIEVEQTELEKILAKYDEAGYEYEYDGPTCTITMAHWDSSGAATERAVVEAVLSGFKKRYPNIDVKVEIQQSYEDHYGEKIITGQAHDVFLVPDGSIPKWASTGKLENLDPYINSSFILDTEEMNDIYPSCLTRYKYNATTGRMGSGSQLALPKDVGPYVMYYNKDWFKAMNVELPPSDRIMTIEEARTMWKALKKYDSSNKVIGYGVAGLPIEGLVWSAGGDFLNEDRTAFPTNDKTIEGLKKGYQFMKESYLVDKIQPPSSFVGTMDPSALFSQQMVATVISGRWDVSTFRNLSFDWDIAYVPAFSENPTKNMYSGSVGYAVHTGSKNKLAAWKLVEYIASKEGQEILSATGFQIPVYESLALDEEIVAREKENKPYNYEIFVHSAKQQGYGLWQYRSNTLWKVKGYDENSELLYSEDPSTEITVEEFINIARTDVNANCSN